MFSNYSITPAHAIAAMTIRKVRVIVRPLPPVCVCVCVFVRTCVRACVCVCVCVYMYTMDRQEMAAALLRLISFSFDLYSSHSTTQVTLAHTL